MSPELRRLLLLLLCVLFLTNSAADSKEKPRKKKDIRDYNDADMARLLEQWEVSLSGAFCASANAVSHHYLDPERLQSHYYVPLTDVLWERSLWWRCWIPVVTDYREPDGRKAR